MRKHEKETELILLKHEDDVLKELEKTYKKALNDTKKKIKELNAKIQELIEADAENETLIRSKIYQRKYQEALLEQLENNMKLLKEANVKTIDDYLLKMYEDGYYTNIYNLQMRGVPVTVPINQDLLIKSLTRPTEEMKFSTRLYKDVDKLKQKVIAETTRGIATGMSYSDIAMNLQMAYNMSLRKANQIAQNEGQRVKTDARLDSIHEAKKKGADIVKVWDSTLDNKTRPVHRELDQAKAEDGEPFIYSGGEVMAPKHFGIPSQDINCRCVLMSVPRWDIEETIQKRDNITGKIIECKNYYDWLDKYHAELKGNK